MMREIHLSTPGGTLLPSIKFFEPNKRFWVSMVRFRSSVIYDVGAGMGHVSAELVKKGFKGIGLDICLRPGMDKSVLLSNGVSHQYMPKSLVLICRPCHSGFAQYVVDQAVECKARAVGYVGFKKNMDGDLGHWADRFKLKDRLVGRERESLFIMEVAK